MTQSNVVRVNILVDKTWEEVLLAEMAEMGFHAFENEGKSLVGYIDESRWSSENRDLIIRSMQGRLKYVQIQEDIIPPQNWNEQWEASIEPVVAGGFVVLPTWKPIPEQADTVDPIYIDPKMSFGTGHHETTRLMLELMSELDFRDKKVLDAGTGTGVLSIAAEKRGASAVVGFDIDPWSSKNADENLALNKTSRVQILEGSLECVPNDKFDIILANIVQNVIEDLLPGFAQRIRSGGRLVISGILEKDADRLLDRAASVGFNPAFRLQESEWVAYTLVPKI